MKKLKLLLLLLALALALFSQTPPENADSIYQRLNTNDTIRFKNDVLKLSDNRIKELLEYASYNADFDVVKQTIEFLKLDKSYYQESLISAVTYGFVSVYANQNDFIERLNIFKLESSNRKKENYNLISKYLINKGADVLDENMNYEESSASLLMWASLLNNFEIVKLLIEKGVDINYCKIDGENALYNAFCGENMEIFSYLVHHGADINEKVRCGTSLIEDAIQSGYKPEWIKLLIDLGADPNQKTSEDLSLIEYSAYVGNITAIETLVNNGVKYNSDIGTDLLCLTSSVQSKEIDNSDTSFTGKHLETIDWLLYKGVYVNAVYSFYGTALFYAAKTGNSTIVNYLINAGADPNIPASNGQTPLMQAVLSGDSLLVKTLLTYDNNINRQDKNGITALMLASENNNPQTVEMLLQKNADNQLIAKTGYTAYDYAFVKNNTKVLEAFYKYGIKKNKNSDKFKQILLFVKQNDLKKLKKFINRENANITDSTGYSILMLAIQRKNLPLTLFLINKGADVNYIDKISGSSSFFESVKCGSEDLTRLLLKKKCQINDCDENGKIPLFYAIDKNYTEIALLLLKNGSKTYNSKNEEGLLFLAQKNKNFAIFKEILSCETDLSSKDDRKLGYFDWYWILEQNPSAVIEIIRKGYDQDYYDQIYEKAFSLKATAVLKEILIKNPKTKYNMYFYRIDDQIVDYIRAEDVEFYKLLLKYYPDFSESLTYKNFLATYNIAFYRLVYDAQKLDDSYFSKLFI